MSHWGVFSNCVLIWGCQVPTNDLPCTSETPQRPDLGAAASGPALGCSVPGHHGASWGEPVDTPGHLIPTWRNPPCPWVLDQSLPASCAAAAQGRPAARHAAHVPSSWPETGSQGGQLPPHSTAFPLSTKVNKYIYVSRAKGRNCQACHSRAAITRGPCVLL